MQDGDTSYVMKQYFFCLLKRGDHAANFSKEELEKIQEGHLAHIGKLANEGVVAAHLVEVGQNASGETSGVDTARIRGYGERLIALEGAELLAPLNGLRHRRRRRQHAGAEPPEQFCSDGHSG